MPDVGTLKAKYEIRPDDRRQFIYKYMCVMDKAIVFFEPHKYGEHGNARIPFTRIDMNPKNFSSYAEFESYLFSIFQGNPFDDSELTAKDFNLSRLDIAADLENIPPESLLALLHVKNIRARGINFYKGTIYAGKNPMIRIYDKTAEIRARMKKARDITEYERSLIDSRKQYTRFEVEVKSPKVNLQSLVDDPVRFQSYFDRLEIFRPEVGDSGVMHCLHKFINRKFKKELEALRDFPLVERIKQSYTDSVRAWFKADGEPF
jgi:hypothetical protein